jgi:hypothetical protein
VIDVRTPAPSVQRWLLVAAGLLAAISLVVVVLDDGPDHLELARAELADDAAFARSSTAGEALLRSSVELQAAGTACDDPDPACARLLTASAMARVASVRILECRRPEIFTFRRSFRGYLDDLADGLDPTPPSPPACD